MQCLDEKDEYSFEPRSFCEIEERGVPKLFIKGMAKVIEQQDDGIDKPGDAHVPSESNFVKYIEDFPQLFKAMFDRLNDKAGPWIHDPNDRADAWNIV